VHSGSSATSTIECAAGTCCSASAVSNGKPSTTPPATTANDAIWERAGRGCRHHSSTTSASNPAMLARATVSHTGGRSSTASRVAGSEPLKITTPIRPLSQPWELWTGVDAEAAWAEEVMAVERGATGTRPPC
jgi:hypothetical protein